jgi:general secretion pathway protein G
MKTLRKNTRRAAAPGFTLIEIMLVLAIIALLMGVGIWKLAGVTDRGKETRVKADLGALMTALVQYQITAGSYPSTEQGLAALVNKPAGVRNWSPALDEPMYDPWQNEYGYRYPPTKNRNGKPDIFSRGPDGLENSADDIGNWPTDS